MLCCFHVLFGKRLNPPKLFIGPSQQKSSHLTCNTLAKALSAALWLVWPPQCKDLGNNTNTRENCNIESKRLNNFKKKKRDRNIEHVYIYIVTVHNHIIHSRYRGMLQNRLDHKISRARLAFIRTKPTNGIWFPNLQIRPYVGAYLVSPFQRPSKEFWRFLISDPKTLETWKEGYGPSLGAWKKLKWVTNFPGIPSYKL